MEQWLRSLFIFQQGMDELLHQNWTATLRCFTHLYIYIQNVLAHQFFKIVEVEAAACGADPEDSVLQNVSQKQTLLTYKERESFPKRKREETDRKLANCNNRFSVNLLSKINLAHGPIQTPNLMFR